MNMTHSNASQPTCISTSRDVHHVYMYKNCPDAGTLLSPLNIAVCVYVCVCDCIIVFCNSVCDVLF